MLKAESKNKLKMVVTGGGTGGHLFPAIAVAEALLQQNAENRVLFIGTGRQLDNLALANRPFATATLKCPAIKGKNLFGGLLALLKLPFSLMAAIRLIKDFQADLVFAAGGYVSGPVGLAAWLLKIPVLIHEQNSVPGLTNRLLGHLARRVFVSLPGSEHYFPAGKTVLSGNPIRSELLAASHAAARPHEKTTLLVLGGSQGAHRLNLLMLEAAARIGQQLRNWPGGFEIIHQTGGQDEQLARETYARLGLVAQVAPFIQAMAAAYNQADLVIARAGATTLAELLIFKKAAILVPYPYAADNHQAKNADHLVKNGGARMFYEAELTGPKLGAELIGLLTDPQARQEMAQKNGQLARPEATETILNGCLEVVTTGRRLKVED